MKYIPMIMAALVGAAVSAPAAAQGLGRYATARTAPSQAYRQGQQIGRRASRVVSPSLRRAATLRAPFGRGRWVTRCERCWCPATGPAGASGLRLGLRGLRRPPLGRRHPRGVSAVWVPGATRRTAVGSGCAADRGAAGACPVGYVHGTRRPLRPPLIERYASDMARLPRRAPGTARGVTCGSASRKQSKSSGSP